MILYLRIATDIPAGTAITTRYIMDKYKVSRSTSRNALAVLAHIGAAEEISRIHTEGTVYSLSPDAEDKAKKYRNLVIIMRKNPIHVRRNNGPILSSPADMAEQGVVSAHNRLFSALATKCREMKQSSGVMSSCSAQ